MLASRPRGGPRHDPGARSPMRWNSPRRRPTGSCRSTRCWRSRAFRSTARRSPPTRRSRTPRAAGSTLRGARHEPRRGSRLLRADRLQRADGVRRAPGAARGRHEPRVRRSDDVADRDRDGRRDRRDPAPAGRGAGARRAGHLHHRGLSRRRTARRRVVRAEDPGARGAPAGDEGRRDRARAHAAARPARDRAAVRERVLRHGARAVSDDGRRRYRRRHRQLHERVRPGDGGGRRVVGLPGRRAAAVRRRSLVYSSNAARPPGLSRARRGGQRCARGRTCAPRPPACAPRGRGASGRRPRAAGSSRHRASPPRPRCGAAWHRPPAAR